MSHAIGRENAFPNLKKLIAPGIMEQISEGGLTKREYFAGLAMQGMQAAMFEKANHDLLSQLTEKTGEIEIERLIARLAVYQADCLLERLAKEDANETL